MVTCDWFLNQSDKPILIVGRAGMDLYPDPPGTRTQDAIHFYAALGGSSANIAVALSQQGFQTSLVTRVSDDAIGRFVIAQLQSYGVDSTHVKPVGEGTRASLAVVESRVDDHQSIIYRNNASDFRMDISDIEQIDFSKYSTLIITGTCLTLEPSRSAAILALKQAKSHGLKTIMDLDYRPYSWESKNQAKEVYELAVDLLDVVIGNDEEFGHMAGDYLAGEGLARRLAAKGKLVVYKRGEEGSRTYIENAVIETGIVQVKPLKPTGAGDSFLGAFIGQLFRSDDLADALIHGSCCAAIVVANIGCAPAMPSKEQLKDFVKQHRQDVSQQSRVP